MEISLGFVAIHLGNNTFNANRTMQWKPVKGQSNIWISVLSSSKNEKKEIAVKSIKKHTQTVSHSTYDFLRLSTAIICIKYKAIFVELFQ